jgi:hypothetical protein
MGSGRHGPHSIETKTRAAAMMAAGFTHRAIADELGLNKNTPSKWAMEDPEFIALRAEITDRVITANVQKLRALTTKAIDALERGLDSNTRHVAGKDGEVIELPDDSLAVRTADLTLKRIGEFAEQSHVDVSGSLLEHWMTELDVDSDEDPPE